MVRESKDKSSQLEDSSLLSKFLRLAEESLQENWEKQLQRKTYKRISNPAHWVNHMLLKLEENLWPISKDSKSWIWEENSLSLLEQDKTKKSQKRNDVEII